VNHAPAVRRNCAAFSALVKVMGSPGRRQKAADQVVMVRQYTERSASSDNGQETGT